MTMDRWLFYRTWAISWIVLGCTPGVVSFYLLSSNATSFDESYGITFKPVVWFATFPIAWTLALLVVRYQELLRSSVAKILGRILLFFACLIALPFLFMGCATSAWLAPFPPKFQVEQDHGVLLPNSVVVRHRENSGVPWMDSHATADVVIAASDLPGFVKQLEPAPPNHLFGGPWQEKKPDGSTEYNCRSKNSDGQFFVTVAPAKDGHIQVRLGTVTD